jgi:hypothetical protein
MTSDQSPMPNEPLPQAQSERGQQRRPIAMWRSSCAFVIRTIRAVKILVRDGRIPRSLRWGGALGLLPIPGPFDEAVLLLVGGILWLFYRERLTEAWRQAASPPVAESASPL